MNKLEQSIAQNLYGDVRDLEELSDNYEAIAQAIEEVNIGEQQAPITPNLNNREMREKIDEVSSYIKCLVNDKHIPLEQISQTVVNLEMQLTKKLIFTFLNSIASPENAYKVLQFQEFIKGESCLYVYEKSHVRLFPNFDLDYCNGEYLDMIQEKIQNPDILIGLHKVDNIGLIENLISGFDWAFDGNKDFSMKLHKFMLKPENFFLRLKNEEGSEFEIISLSHMDFFEDELNDFLSSKVIQVELIQKPSK